MSVLMSTIIAIGYDALCDFTIPAQTFIAYGNEALVAHVKIIIRSLQGCRLDLYRHEDTLSLCQQKNVESSSTDTTLYSHLVSYID